MRTNMKSKIFIYSAIISILIYCEIETILKVLAFTGISIFLVFGISFLILFLKKKKNLFSIKKDILLKAIVGLIFLFSWFFANLPIENTTIILYICFILILSTFYYFKKY